MHDYKNNLFKPSIEPKDRLEQTILLDLLPEKDLNRPSYSVATISRIMSNYIRTLRHIVKREWSFEVLNLYESVFPLFVDFYECVVANELAVRKDNVEWGEIWNSKDNPCPNIRLNDSQNDATKDRVDSSYILYKDADGNWQWEGTVNGQKYTRYIRETEDEAKNKLQLLS